MIANAATHLTPSPRRWSERLLDHSAVYVGLTLLVTLVAGLFTTVLFHGRAQERARHALEADARQLAAQLDRVVDQGMISGALRVMGTLDERVKDRLTLGRPVDMATRALTVGADGLLLIDTYGRVLERWDPDQERSTAPVWADLVESARRAESAGQAVVQVVIDSATMDHSLLLLAPVWSSGASAGQNLIGSLVARLDPGTVRRHVAMSNARITLVAPNGRLVAASTAQGSLLRPPEPNEARAKAGLYPLPPGEEGSGASRVIVRHHLGWNSPQMIDTQNPNHPTWSIVVTQDLPPIDWINGPQVVPALLTLAITPTVLLLLFKLMRMRRDRLHTQRELAEQSRLTAEEAQWRARINDMTLALQDTRNSKATAHVYLQLMQELMGTARGVIYRLQGDQHLEVIGQWACTDPPERLKLGQGLVGQVAQDRQTVDFESAPEDGPPSVISALGRSHQSHRMVLALLHMEECVGVAELEWLSPPTSIRRQRVAQTASLLAMNLRFLGTSAA